MSRKELKSIASMRARGGAIEAPKIAEQETKIVEQETKIVEQLRRSQSRLTIKEGERT